MDVYQEGQLIGGGDTLLHYHLQDRTPTHETLDILQSVQVERTLSASGDILSTDDIVLGDTTAGAITLTLPLAKGGKVYIILKSAGANSVTIQTSGSDTISGASTKVLSTLWSSTTLKASSGRWLVIADA